MRLPRQDSSWEKEPPHFWLSPLSLKGQFMFKPSPQEEGEEDLQHDELIRDNSVKMIMNTEECLQVTEGMILSLCLRYPLNLYLIRYRAKY